MRRFALVALVLALLLPSGGQAQPAASPPRLALQTVSGETTLSALTEPGEVIRDEIRFGADRATDATLRIVNLTSPPNGGIVPDTADSLTAPATWVRLDTGDVTLEPEVPTTLPLEVAIPQDADPGQYLAAVLLEATVPGASGDDLGQVSQAMLIVSVTVTGEQDARFELGEPTVEVRSAGPTLVIPISNTGNSTVAPAGDLTLDQVNGKTVTLPVTLGPVLPGVTTTIEMLLADIPAGETELRLALADPATGARARITSVTIEIPDGADGPPPTTTTGDDDTPGTYVPDGEPVDITIRNARLTPNGSPVEYVTVTADVVNIGDPVGPVSLVMEVNRNGQVVETVTLVEFASVPRATLGLNTTYTPIDGFTSGLWTFRLRLVDANGDVLAQTGTIAKLDLT